MLRSAVLLAIATRAHGMAARGETCDAPLIVLAEKLFNVSDPLGLARALVGVVQHQCDGGACPHIDLHIGNQSCVDQSVDDVNCSIRAFETDVRLGDGVCDAGCNDWPCKAACDGIDVGICYGADYILCKAGCLGISSCVHKCEEAIVEPCKRKLIEECDQKCEQAFAACKAECKNELALHLGVTFLRLRHAVSSLSIDALSLGCNGDGMTQPLAFDAAARLSLDGLQIETSVQTRDAGVSSSSEIWLDSVSLTLTLPLSGSLWCGAGHSSVDLRVGAAAVAAFDLDVKVDLDKWLQTLAQVVCLGLPWCKGELEKSIATAVKEELVRYVPDVAAAQITQLLSVLAQQARCPEGARVGVTAVEDGAAPVLAA